MHIDCVVVGAGVIGLAVAREIARRGREVIVLEAQAYIGSEVSSRNSGVIHAGIYYPTNSLRAQLCVAGKHALYDFCERFGVSHQRIGKLLVATDDSQLEHLERFATQARINGVCDLQRLSADEARAYEPEVQCVGALFSPSTGIIDVHEYLHALEGDLQHHGGFVTLNTPLLSGDVSGRCIKLRTGGAEPLEVTCNVLVNAAALGAQQVASSLRGFAAEMTPALHLAKGNYFFLAARSPFRHLVYPMPSAGGLGVHVSFDTAGRCRFGPDIHWVDSLDYAVDERHLTDFYLAVRRYWPALPDDALQPDYTGIRPKLSAAGEPAVDFIIQTASEHGIAGLVNLFGIESPGLTASLAIATRVADGLQ